MPNPITWIAKQLDAGWFSRVLVLFQFWFCYFIVDWSMAFASTALAGNINAAPGKPIMDLLGVAAVIGAVAAVPQALLVIATNAYMTMRGTPSAVTLERSAQQAKEAAP